MTANVLLAFQQIGGILRSQEQDPGSKQATVQFLDPTVRDNLWWWEPRTDFKALDTTYPTPAGMDQYGAEVARDLVEFEALRRGTMIVLALQAYRLEHGELPKTLQALALSGYSPFTPIQEPGQAFFKFVPPDPFSGDQFRYFPQGIPDLPKRPDVLRPSNASADGIDNSLANTADEWRRNSIVAGVPGIWSTGPDLVGRQVVEQVAIPQKEQIPVPYKWAWERTEPQTYYWLRWPGYGLNTLPNYEAWGKGIWFPIPAQQK